VIVRMSHSHVLIEKWQLNILSVFASALFQLHPLKTESVYYVAGRFELLSALSFLCACTIFLDGTRHAVVNWSRSTLILILLACAIASKEHAAVPPIPLLTTVVFWASELIPTESLYLRRHLVFR